MSLRARLLAGLVLVLVALVGAGFSVSLVQRDYLYGQLDELLMAGASNFDHMTGPNGGPLFGPGFRGGRHSRIPGDVFVGFVSANGSVTAVPEMQADAALAPELASDTAIANPTTLPTRADDSKYVRVVTAKLRSGVTMVFAVSTTSADQTLRKLVVTLLIGGLAVLAVVALVVWWVIRLGLRPIRRMTEAADAIAGGAVDRRVEGTEGRTEAARLGWTAIEIFGVHPLAPAIRVECWGVAVSVAISPFNRTVTDRAISARLRCEVCEVTANRIRFLTPTGARFAALRFARGLDEAVCIWELAGFVATVKH